EADGLVVNGQGGKPRQILSGRHVSPPSEKRNLQSQLLGYEIVYRSQSVIQLHHIAAAALVGANSAHSISACGENSVPLRCASSPHTNRCRWVCVGSPAPWAAHKPSF